MKSIILISLALALLYKYINNLALHSLYMTGDKHYKQKDYKKAVYWYKKSAKQGYAKAQISLGLMYAQGHGVLKDYKQAVYWYKKSAKQGNPQAQYVLGLVYETGKGVSKDYKKAIYWLKKSAKQGYAKAIKAIFQIFKL